MKTLDMPFPSTPLLPRTCETQIAPLSSRFANNHSLQSSLAVRDQVSHSYKTTDRAIIRSILIFVFLGSTKEDKRFWTER